MKIILSLNPQQKDKAKKKSEKRRVSLQPPLIKMSQKDSVYLPPEALLIWAVLLAGRLTGREG